MTDHQSQNDESGFTLPELLIVVFLMGIVTTVLLGTLDNMTSISASTSAKSAALSESRLAMERMARDLRAANPVDAISSSVPTATYDNEVSFSVYCTGGTNCVSGLRNVKYSVAGNTLTQTFSDGPRVLLAPAASPASVPANLRRLAVVNSASQPVFTYLDRAGQQIATSAAVGNGRPATYFRDCTKRVRIHLVVLAETNRPESAIELETIVNLRNYNEVNPC